MRRLINNTSALALGNGEQCQSQSTASGAQRATGVDGDVYPVTFSTDTSAYASGDLIADTQLVSLTAFDQAGGAMIWDSINLIDEDAQGVKLYIVLLSASTSLGTENSAPNISDANTRLNLLAYHTVLTTDYITISGVKHASIGGINKLIKAASGSQALYVAILNETGTPTYTATGLRGQLGFRQA